MFRLTATGILQIQRLEHKPPVTLGLIAGACFVPCTSFNIKAVRLSCYRGPVRSSVPVGALRTATAISAPELHFMLSSKRQSYP